MHDLETIYKHLTLLFPEEMVSGEWVEIAYESSGRRIYFDEAAINECIKLNKFSVEGAAR